MGLETKNLGQVRAMEIGSVAPTNTTMVWYDTSVSYHKWYNTLSGNWEPLAFSPSGFLALVGNSALTPMEGDIYFSSSLGERKILSENGGFKSEISIFADTLGYIGFRVENNLGVGTSFINSLVETKIESNRPTFAGLQYGANYSTNFTLRSIPDIDWITNQNYLTANQNIDLIGDVTGAGSTSINVTIPATVVTSKRLTGYTIGSVTPVEETDTILAAFGKLQAQFASRINKGGDSGVGSFTFLDSQGIDVDPLASVLNIGTSNATVINIGWSGAEVNIWGTRNFITTTDLEIKDKLFRLNKGGGVDTGFSSGFEIEEDNIVTGWFATNGTRNGWDFKAPNSFQFSLDLSALTSPTIGTIQPSNGTFAWLSDITAGSFLGTLLPSQGGTGYNTYTAGDILYADSISTFAKLPIAGPQNILTSNGVGGVPVWEKLSLINSVVEVLRVENGGTGQFTYDIGDLLFADSTSTLNKLSAVVAGNALISQGVGTAPVWGKISLVDNISGILRVDNGGSGVNVASLVEGGILFYSTLSGTPRFNNDNEFFWDATNKRFRVGLTGDLPTAKIHIAAGVATASGAPLKFTPGTNLTVVENGAVEYDGIDLFLSTGGTRYIIPRILVASTNLDFPSVINNSFADLTVSVIGATVNDCVSLGIPNTSIIAGATNFYAWVSAPNIVTIRFTNNSGATQNPNLGTFKVIVFKNI